MTNKTLIQSIIASPEKFGLGHLINLEQNTKYHQFDAWTHTVEVYKNAVNVKPEDVAFQLAALFHDAGKGTESIRKYKDGITPSDVGHEKISLSIAKEVIGQSQEWLKVEMLISLHHSIGSTDVKSVKKLIKKLLPYSSNKEQVINNLLDLLLFVECDANGGFTEELSLPLFEKYNQIKQMIVDGFFEDNLFFIEDMPLSVRQVMEYGIDEKKARHLLVSLMENGKIDIDDIKNKIEKELSK